MMAHLNLTHYIRYVSLSCLCACFVIFYLFFFPLSPPSPYPLATSISLCMRMVAHYCFIDSAYEYQLWKQKVLWLSGNWKCLKVAKSLAVRLSQGW